MLTNVFGFDSLTRSLYYFILCVCGSLGRPDDVLEFWQTTKRDENSDFGQNLSVNNIPLHLYKL